MAREATVRSPVAGVGRFSRRDALRGFLGVAGASLAGCMTGPDFTPPVAPVADKWLEWRSKSLKSAETPADWWRLFRDPVLNRLIETAYSQNLTLLSAGTKVLEARAELGVAIGEFYPQMQTASAAVNYDRASNATPASQGGNSMALGNFWADRWLVQSSWEIDLWGKFRRGIESADAAYLGSIASYDDVLVTLLSDVASAYIGIRTLERQIAIARANVARQRESVRIARTRFEGGASTLLDVHQAQNVLASTEATIPRLMIQLKHGMNALRVLLGMAPEPLGFLLARGAAKIPFAPPRAAVGIPADLLRRRPDIRVAELRAAAQSAQIGVAQAELYPAISISGAFGGQASNVGHNLGQMVQPMGRAFAIGPSFKWNLLNYGQIANNVRLQDATLQQYLIDYQNQVLKAQQEVENGVATYLLSASEAAYLRKSVTEAKGALEIATLEYQQGTRDFTTVLTAEQNLLAAENSLATATGNISIGLVSLYRALGGGWQIREGKPFVDAATVQEMRDRTNWGNLLPDAAQPGFETPGLPSAQDVDSSIKLPEW
ncbi:TolC family protein [Methylocystis parvus]|uniref:TolC family protein n=3 Tax=Methylocystis parvus TaxID=134 RepID=A0A6B8MA32_9HYPH|nr:TolC family protein [Methylocystis parvus]QGM99546.1 TolC family protein [Methylocystis parvus]